VDEAVFTGRLQSKIVWALAGKKVPTIYKPRIGFKAIAVTGGINMKGEMIAYTLNDYSVDTDKFITFLAILRSKFSCGIRLYVFLDNLSVHHSHKVR